MRASGQAKVGPFQAKVIAAMTGAIVTSLLSKFLSSIRSRTVLIISDAI